MIQKGIHILLLLSIFLCLQKETAAQEKDDNSDTFFLGKKKGLLGRFAKSISRRPPDEAPVKVENQFLKFRGKIIRSIEIVRLGFEYELDDTTQIKKNFAVMLGKAFHRKTSDHVIRKNLFFKKGTPLSPFLLADNERFLRSLPYIKDARVLVDYGVGSTDSVDVVVLTKDVFSIAGNLSVSSLNKGRVRLREENLMGTGDQISVSGYYEDPRSPNRGVGGELIRRNIGGTFIDWVSGYQDYGYAFSSQRNQETVVYTRIEKPLVTPYMTGTGALEWSYQRTRNVYDSDSIYEQDFKYQFYNLDAWFAYNLNRKKAMAGTRQIQVHRFASVRWFKQHFLQIPRIFKDSFDYRYTDFTGGLLSLSIFRQVFYKSSFIYGFGRSEDIPEGFSAALIAGYVEKQNSKRPYAGLDFSLANFKTRGFYSSYTVRFGGYFFRSRFEDADLLFNVNHFTRLRRISKSWYNRIFINTGITAQINPVLNSPLFLNSEFGLPYFNNGTLSSDLRGTIKSEAVFYNTTKVLGFRFAPFILADAILLKPVKLGLKHSNIFTSIGGGIRTRNENLVFGTVELKWYYFPRTNGDMKPWKVELSSNIRFQFKRNFISRPDFILSN